MYLIYNRDYELVGEVKDFKQVKDNIGEDIREQDVNSLEFIRGKTVISEDNLKRLVNKIVSKEKSEVVDYITEEVENQEDETVELKTSNRHLQNKIVESNEYLTEISQKIGKAVEDSKELTDLDVSTSDDKTSSSHPTPVVEDVKTKEDEETKEEGQVKEFEELEVEHEEAQETTNLDDETKNILKHIKRNHKSSASKVIPDKRKKTSTDINFISIIEGKRVSQIENLKGLTFIKTSKLADEIGLDREHVEYLIDNVLVTCGGTPDYQNKSVVSPSEAVWIVVSALTKRDGYTTRQRFQKTIANTEDFYHSWEQQKEEIKEKLA